MRVRKTKLNKKLDAACSRRGLSIKGHSAKQKRQTGEAAARKLGLVGQSMLMKLGLEEWPDES